MKPEDEAVVKELHYDGKDMSIALEHPVVAHVAAEMARLFKEGGGVNYVALTMTDNTDDTAYTVTIQPQEGKPVYQVNAELLEHIKGLLDGIENVRRALEASGALNLQTTVCLDVLLDQCEKLKAAYPAVTEE
jgi:hypothetical protein